MEQTRKPRKPTQQHPSDDYVRALAEATAHHASSKTYSGKFLRPHAPFIRDLLREHACRSVLDYGCGKGEQYRWVSHGEGASIPGGMTLADFWGIEPTLYDPAWPPYARDPEHAGPFDMTIVTHTLGSIPLADLNCWVMPRLAKLTRKVCYIAEKIGEVRKDVFSEPSTMPRFHAGEWRAFAAITSGLPEWKRKRIVLSLRTRDDETDATNVHRFSYRNGEETAWP